VRVLDMGLALGLLAWAGGQIVRAHAELQDRPVVTGLHRDWRPPVPEGPLGGELIDPRATSLAEELATRYGLGAVPDAPDTHGPGDGSAPRLVWPAADAPVLVVGAWGGDLVVFVPGLGVAVADPARLPDTLPARALDVPRERPY
jgi:hypothetical protein